MKQIISAIAMLFSMQLTAQNVGIGTNQPQQKLDVAGKVTVRDSLGIGISNPNAPLQFGNSVENRKIVLYDGFGDNHRFYGFGINGGVLRYQTDTESSDHVFYAGVSNVASSELIRIKGNGNVGIGTSTPTARLEVNGRVRFRGDLDINSSDAGGTWLYLTNTSSTATGWKIISTGTATPGGAGHLYFYDSANQAQMTILKDGNVGIGLSNPAEKLSVNGDLKISGTLKTGHVIVNKSFVLAANTNNVVQCSCPAGTTLTGGGGGNITLGDYEIRNTTISYSGPDLDPSFTSKMWTIYAANSGMNAITIRVYAICARIGN